MTATTPSRLESTTSSDPAEPLPALNPYPGADDRKWVTRMSEALAAHAGVPREVTDQIAPFVVQPKRYLKKSQGTESLDASQITRNSSGQQVLRVEVHGFAGSPHEHNERLHTDFHSPFAPTADSMTVLPVLEVGSGVGGDLAPYLTAATAITPEHQANLLAVMERALTAKNVKRDYNLTDDLAEHGQQAVPLHVPNLRRILEQGANGTHVRHQVDLAAISGSNRAAARLALFGLSAHDIVFGVRPRTVMGLSPRDGEEPVAAPAQWVPVLSDLLRRAYDDPHHPGHAKAVRARKVATIHLDLIIGAQHLSSFHTDVFSPNRMDHRRASLEWEIAERASADMRSLLSAYAADGMITEGERAWLAGQGPDPAPVQAESAVDSRDRRDRRLYAAVFPGTDVHADPRARAVLRRVMGEPAHSELTNRHVATRTRMFAAAASDGYGSHWNPRNLDGLVTAAMTKKGTVPPMTASWQEELDAADRGDHDAMSRFIITRGMNWVASAGLITADRGSISGQTNAELREDEEEASRRVRRGMADVRDALAAGASRSVALFRELAQAATEGRAPRRVDRDGHPVDGSVATSAWFDEHFPKRPRSERRGASNAGTTAEQPTPQQPDPTPAQLRAQARDQYVAVVVGDLMDACAAVAAAGRNLNAAADAAGMAPLGEEDEVVIALLERALQAAKKDVSGAAAAVSAMKHNTADADDFTSMAQGVLTEALV